LSDSSPAPAGPQPSDLGADLSAAWDAQAAPDPASPAAGKASASTSSSGDAATAKADESGTRARDETGRFAKTNGTATTAPVSDKPEAKPAAKPDAKAAPDAKAEVADPKGEAKPAEFKVPDKWPADVRAKLEALHTKSPEDAKFVLDQFNLVRTQQGLIEQAKAKLGPLHKIMGDVEGLLATGRQQRALNGIDDPTYVRNLIAAGEYLEKSPAEGLRYLAQRYGIDLQKLANGEGQKPEIPEHVQQIMQENAQIKQFLAKQQQDAAHGQFRAAVSWIDQFASQKAPDGNPVYPHFDEVLPEIIVNVQYQKERGEQVDVKAAYERAVRMNDSVWLKIQGARSEAERKSANEKRLREIEEAKRAGFSVSGSGGATSDRPAESIRGELERLWDTTQR
jgi:hypothetical protein